MLYDTGHFKLARKRKLKPAEKKRIAQDHFNRWFKTAKAFYNSSQRNFNAREYKVAAFDLHQAAEHAYKAVILIFTEYNPREHYLWMLGEMAAEHCPDLIGIFPREIFPRETDEQNKLFLLLDYAYIGARYDPNYKITKKQLEYLASRVKKLQKLTRTVCRKKIESYG